MDNIEIESYEHKDFWYYFNRVILVVVILTVPVILFTDFIINLFTK